MTLPRAARLPGEPAPRRRLRIASWRARLLLAFVALLVPVGLWEVYDSGREYGDQEAQVLEAQVQTARAVASGVEAVLNDLRRSLALVAHELERDRLPPPEAAAYLASIRPLVWPADFLILVDADGVAVAAAPDEGRFGAAAARPAYVQAVLAGGRPWATSNLVPDLPEGRLGIGMAHVVRDSSGRVAGAVIGFVLGRTFGEALGPPQLAPDTVFAIIDGTGRAIYHSAYPDLPWAQRDWSASADVQAALGGRVGRTEALESTTDGVIRIGATVPVPLVGWAVGVFRPRAAALAPVTDALRRQLLQLAVLACIVGAAAWLLADRIVRPMRALQAGAEALGAGRLDVRVPDDSPDELGQLGRAFNAMADRLGRQMGELAAANAALRAVLESVPEGLVLVEASGRVALANPAARAILGREPAAEHLPVDRALSGETFTDVEVRVAVDGRERVLRAAGAPIFDEGGGIAGAAVAFDDITERKALEQLKAEFLARASHELRTPLTSALGTIRLLKRAIDGELPESPDALLAIANRNLRAMANLIDDLLDASKLESGRITLAREDLEIGPVVSASLEVVGAQARDKGVALRVAVPPELRLRADRLKLEQVLVNLLANAVKFTPAGGEIAVEAGTEAGSAVIRVRDTGEGIPREHLEAIFEPFFQAGGRGGRRPRGTGLGLAICRQIVTLHGGTITAESDGPGRGSTFIVRLPLASAAPASREAREELRGA